MINRSWTLLLAQLLFEPWYLGERDDVCAEAKWACVTARPGAAHSRAAPLRVFKQSNPQNREALTGGSFFPHGGVAVGQSSTLPEQHVPNDVTGLRGLVGAVGAEAGKEGWGTAMLGSMEPYAIAAGLSVVHQTLSVGIITSGTSMNHTRQEKTPACDRRPDPKEWKKTGKRIIRLAGLVTADNSVTGWRFVCLTDKEWIITLAIRLTNASAVDHSNNHTLICISSLESRTKTCWTEKIQFLLQMIS